MTQAERFAIEAAKNNNQRVREDILEKYGHVRHENEEIKQRDQIERLFKENQSLGHV